ncbi:MAG: sigma 54-interacting transcriptional regulator, partial [Caldilinea sp.]
ALQTRVAAAEGPGLLIGASPAMRPVQQFVETVAPTDATVLITGETGTGKEVVARSIYMQSHRAGMPFVPVNCGAVAQNLAESELFGHRKGSFTGADKDRKGMFEVANGGTLYVPKVVHHMTDANGGVQKDFEPEIKRELPISKEDMEFIRRGMWEVINSDYGTGRVARVSGVEVAGKTGTAEFCEYIPEERDCRRDEKGFLPFHAWFSAFAPYDNPEIAIVTFIYDGGEGSAVAAPVTQKILEAYFTEISPRPQSTAAQP